VGESVTGGRESVNNKYRTAPRRDIKRTVSDNCTRRVGKKDNRLKRETNG